MQRFEKDIPDMLEQILDMCFSHNIVYDDIDDMINDWLLPKIENLPKSWVSEISNSIQADAINDAIESDARFKAYLK